MFGYPEPRFVGEEEGQIDFKTACDNSRAARAAANSAGAEL